VGKFILRVEEGNNFRVVNILHQDLNFTTGTAENFIIIKVPSTGMLRRVAFVITDVSEELSSSFVRVTRIVIPSSPILAILMLMR
jgi:hypothetical protein